MFAAAFTREDSGRLLSLEGDTSKHHSHNGDPGADPKVFTNPPGKGYSSQIPEGFHWGIAAFITAGKAGMQNASGPRGNHHRGSHF